MNRPRTLIVGAALIAGLALTGCTITPATGGAPDTGTVVIPPIAPTMTDSPLVPPDCYAGLRAFGEPVVSTINLTNVDLGFRAVNGEPPTDDLHALRVLGDQLGVSACAVLP